MKTHACDRLLTKEQQKCDDVKNKSKLFHPIKMFAVVSARAFGVFFFFNFFIFGPVLLLNSMDLQGNYKKKMRIEHRYKRLFTFFFLVVLSLLFYSKISFLFFTLHVSICRFCFDPSSSFLIFLSIISFFNCI